MQPTRLNRKKKRPWKRVLLLVVVMLFAGATSYASYLVYQTKNVTSEIYEPLEGDTEETLDDKLNKIQTDNEPFSILIAGIDDEDGGKYGRSDVVLVATVNPEKETITMVSIPRDSYVYIPELDYYDKINHAYANGGIRYTIETVEELFEIPIDYYVTTNFQGFQDIVDSLGGIEIDVPFTFKTQLSGSLKGFTFEEGEMSVNGNEALAYVRMRKSDPRGDLGRNERQQEVIKEILNEATKISSIPKFDNFLQDIKGAVRTNIPSNQYLQFMKLYRELGTVEINQIALEGYDNTQAGIYYYGLTDESVGQVQQTLKRELNISPYASNSNEINTSSE